MGQSRNGGDTADESSFVPSFELIPLEDETDASLFDFGPDLGRPAGAPMAATPPWLAEDAPAGEEDGETRRSRRRNAGVPRARRHRRPEEVAEAQATERLARVPAAALFDDPAEHSDSMDDTADVDVSAVIAAETVAERARKARAGAGREVPTQPKPVERRPAAPPVRILSPKPLPAQGAKLGRTVVPPRPASATPAPAAAVPRRGLNKWVAGLMVAAALGGAAAAYQLGGGFSSSTSTGPTVALAGSAVAARDWVDANLGEKATVLAPASVAAGLKAVNFDSSRVRPYPDMPSGSGATPDWRCCNVLVATAPTGVKVRSGVPNSLQNSYDRSRLLATFTGGGTVTEIRQVLDGTSAEVKEALATEKRARIAAGKEIVGIDRIKLSSSAKADLLAGRVDSRVMLALVGMSRQVEVRVLDFTSDEADRDAGAPARGVRLDRLAGKAISEGTKAAGAVYDFLDVQVAPYRPLDVELSDAEGKSPILEIRYDAPGALGLITPSSTE